MGPAILSISSVKNVSQVVDFGKLTDWMRNEYWQYCGMRKLSMNFRVTVIGWKSVDVLSSVGV